MKILKFGVLVLTVLLSVNFAQAQKSSREELEKTIEKDGCAVAEEGKVKICKFDYRYKNRKVEALTFRPAAAGKYPGLMLIPGYQGTTKTYFSLGTILAKLGFASMTISTPGFGKTEIKPDFLGENTINSYIAGYKKFQKESFVDRDRMGIFGYSRGAIASSLMITRLKDVKAAVLGGGVYDLKKAYDEVTIEGIKENIKNETGLSEKAFRERSVIFKVKKITAPVLIVHGEKDLNAPTAQAYLLRDELKKLNKEVEFQIIAGADHRLGSGFLKFVIDFFSRKLKGKSSEVQIY